MRTVESASLTAENSWARASYWFQPTPPEFAFYKPQNRPSGPGVKLIGWSETERTASPGDQWG